MTPPEQHRPDGQPFRFLMLGGPNDGAFGDLSDELGAHPPMLPAFDGSGTYQLLHPQHRPPWMAHVPPTTPGQAVYVWEPILNYVPGGGRG